MTDQVSKQAEQVHQAIQQTEQVQQAMQSDSERYQPPMQRGLIQMTQHHIDLFRRRVEMF